MNIEALLVVHGYKKEATLYVNGLKKPLKYQDLGNLADQVRWHLDKTTTLCIDGPGHVVEHFDTFTAFNVFQVRRVNVHHFPPGDYVVVE